MTINFQHTLKNGTTVSITATVCDGSVADYSATAKVEKNGVEREVLLAERGSAFDREFIPAIAKRMSECAVMKCDEDEDDLSPDWE